MGIKSSGVHSNGFSLIRKILFKDYKLNINSLLWDDCNKTIGQILIEPTKIYTNEMKPLIEQNIINGAAHITDGGLLENVPRMFNDNLFARINLDSWQIPNVFRLLKDYGNIDDFEMYRDFNMGIGMVISVSADNVSSVMKTFQNQNKADDAIVIGEIIPKSDSSVELVR
ncbi:AIR synthase-related protein [Lactobacillus terrae]|uniref:AIR synthase-related protein n=1 Tax=Lactobacillus terrae TaxID=2269374 RepID=UPI000C1B7B12